MKVRVLPSTTNARGLLRGVELYPVEVVALALRRSVKKKFIAVSAASRDRAVSLYGKILHKSSFLDILIHSLNELHLLRKKLC